MFSVLYVYTGYTCVKSNIKWYNNSVIYVQHYLSYLNCLRVREFGGAVDSLYHFFDRTALISNQEDKIKGFRYAALNLAILHAQFGHM